LTLTSPEQSAHNRQIKRYTAALKRLGICFACQHREVTLGVIHCRGNGARQAGACARDERQPTFAFDVTVMAQFNDAAQGER
jgi:hypothetical protein